MIISLWNFCTFDNVGLIRFAFSLYDVDDSLTLGPCRSDDDRDDDDDAAAVRALH